jgi:lactate dehydrogenase-like 2-hydroxyacid dehydrogenase
MDVNFRSELGYQSAGHRPLDRDSKMGEKVTEKPSVLQVGSLPAGAFELLNQRFQVLTELPADQADGARVILGIATNGKAPIGTELLDRLPGLRIVSCLGAGTDGFDMVELGRRGIGVETTSKVLAADVADLAIGLVIALARDFQRADRYVREGRWSTGKYPLGRALSGSRLGILGLGTIGEVVADRADAFRIEVGYHNRSRRPGDRRHYFDSLMELAEWSTFLVICCPGGPTTHHIVGTSILDALGSKGWLINVARGSVVDEQALVAALNSGAIAGAGLDVFETEPNPHPGLLARDDVIVLPHIGSATVETRDAMAKAMVEALVRSLSPQ